MNIIDKIKLIFNFKDVVEDDYKEAKAMDSTGTKPGWQTTEFWSKVLTIDIPMILGALNGVVSPQVAAYVLLGGNVAYMLVRTWIKRSAVIANLKAILAAVKGGDISTLQKLVDAVTADTVIVTTATVPPAQ